MRIMPDNDDLIEQEKAGAGRDYSGNDLPYLKQVLDSGHLSSIMGGTFVPRFEEAFARAIGAKRAVAMANCMCALHSAVLCAGAGPGTEVICDSEFIFGALAVLYSSAIPVFADIDPVTHNMDPEAIEPLVTDRTRALIVTHAWGLPADMDRILAVARRHKLFVIEDCAESLFAAFKGRLTGAWGDVGCFSFQASKQLSTGDGGMATTSADEIAAKLGEQAGAPTFLSVANALDYNYRMNDLTAAVGLAQLEVMPEFVAGLRRKAALFDQAVAGCPWIKLQRGPEGAEHTFYHWAATLDESAGGGAPTLDAFRAAVKAAGLTSVSVGYTGMPAYKHPVIGERRAHAFRTPENNGHSARYEDGTCPAAERAVPRLILAYLVGAEETAKTEADRLHSLVTRLGRG
jgi:dTDP-4-amino-4,6-dideoxygalactose transaminase